MANSVDPDEMQHSAASHLGLHCLLRPVCLDTYGKYGICKRQQHYVTGETSMCIHTVCPGPINRHAPIIGYLGPVVQSVVSLMSSLRVISLTVLADSTYNILTFFAEKNVSSFCTAKATHIFSAKNFSIFAYHSM